MLPGRRRLRDRRRFQEVRRNGRSWAHPLVVLRALPNEMGPSRLGFTVGRQAGGAVQRNRSKRRLREAVRGQVATLAEGWDLVFIARPPLLEADFAEVQRACAMLLKRAGLLRPPTATKTSRTDENRVAGADPILPESHFAKPAA